MNAALQATEPGAGRQAWLQRHPPEPVGHCRGLRALGWLEFRYPELAWRTNTRNLGKLMDKLMQRRALWTLKPGA